MISFNITEANYAGVLFFHRIELFCKFYGTGFLVILIGYHLSYPVTIYNCNLSTTYLLLAAIFISGALIVLMSFNISREPDYLTC